VWCSEVLVRKCCERVKQAVSAVKCGVCGLCVCSEVKCVCSEVKIVSEVRDERGCVCYVKLVLVQWSVGACMVYVGVVSVKV